MKFNDRLYKCGAAINTFHIDPYGQLYPCLLSRAQGYNLREGNFIEGWENYLQQVRSQPAPLENRCNQCNLLNLCGQCPAKSHLEYGDQNEPVEYFCQIGHLRAAALRETQLII